MIRDLFNQLRSRLKHQKLAQDIAYSVCSFGVLAISGVVVNVAIAGFRDAAALGVFNMAYAFYIIASQFSVWGVHYSVLRYSAYYERDIEERGKMLLTAILCASFIGAAVASLVIIAEPFFAVAFRSNVTALAIKNTAFGLFFFPLNKVLMAYLNGLRYIKAYAALQSLRYLAIMSLVTLVAASSLSIEKSTYCFFFAEMLTMLAACIYLSLHRLWSKLSFNRNWVARHYRYGTKAMPAGIFTEVNSRLDVLLIGFFLSEHAIGVYSFAAMLVDGLYNVLTMIRTNFNPLLIVALRDGRWATLQGLLAQSLKVILPTTSVISLVLIFAYYIATSWIIPLEKGFLEGLPSLTILLVGLTSISFFIPFDNLLMVSGHPGYQTIQQIILVLVNIAAALILIPSFGIEGAALATSLSFITGVFAMIFFANTRLGWNLLTNKLKV